MNLSDLASLISLPEWEQYVFLWKPNSEEPMLALGCRERHRVEKGQPWSFGSLEGTEKWWFGFLTYDLKDVLEEGLNTKDNAFELPMWEFFSPKLLLKWVEGEWEEVVNELKFPWRENLSKANDHSVNRSRIDWKPLVEKQDYVRSVEALKDHISKGDIYEINFTHPFEAKVESLDSYSYFQELNAITEAPYAAYFRMGIVSLCCASPELFLRKKGNKIYSSPIKGTVKRGTTEEEDLEWKNRLSSDEKEKAENVMIVDLVRNDFSKIAKPSSVEVTELFGIHTFKTVHHMISTVGAEVDENVGFDDIIFATFPMGSMTGAPKPAAMQLAEKWEKSSRGLYSGSVGVISPNGDIELNVVIRSVIRDERTGYMRFNVGGAITYLCSAEKEYEESLLKARAILSLA